MITPKPINPFSPDYVSQITPIRDHSTQKQRPVLLSPVKYFLDNIAPNQEGKRARLLRAAI